MRRRVAEQSAEHVRFGMKSSYFRRCANPSSHEGQATKATRCRVSGHGAIPLAALLTVKATVETCLIADGPQLIGQGQDGLRHRWQVSRSVPLQPASALLAADPQRVPISSEAMTSASRTPARAPRFIAHDVLSIQGALRVGRYPPRAQTPRLHPPYGRPERQLVLGRPNTQDWIGRSATVRMPFPFPP